MNNLKLPVCTRANWKKYGDIARKYICGGNFQDLSENNIKRPWLGQLDIYMQKNELGFCFTPNVKLTKINQEVKNLNYKVLKEKKSIFLELCFG